MSNVLNYFEQPTGTANNDNILVLDGTVEVNGSSFSAQKLANVLNNNDFLVRSTNGALLNNGFNLITGGTGLASLTLAAPQPGVRCDIIVATLSSGNVVVTTASGVTFNGTNNTATFNAANDQLTLVYKSATEWQIVYNNSVTLSTV